MKPISSVIPFPDSPSAISPMHGRASTSSTPILGRDDDIRDVLQLLDKDDLRIVTLLGPGGVGKTRLAREVAGIIAASYAHGAWFVPLESIRDPDLVPKAVAQSLGIQETADRTAIDSLTQLLSDRHLLLVLDNLEQVIGAASPWLSNLIAEASRIKVLATSRIALNIDGEQQFIVSPLAVPDHEPERSAAVTLFAQRAQAMNLSFVLDDRTATTVAEICRQLDGLPLAIELAAARTKILSPKALLGRLTDRITLLSGGHHNLHPRLQSMRDAIGWSYELLSEEDSRLFRRLSVFLGGFTLDAAEFVAEWPHQPVAGAPVLDTLQSLVDQSLVQIIPNMIETRFRMLETIREYGVHEVLNRAEADIAYGAHAEYVRQVSERAEIALMGPDQAVWLNRLEAEYPNIRDAMSWLDAHGRLDDALEVNARVQFFLTVRGHSVESLDRLESWLNRPELAARTRPRGLALMAMGGLLQNIGESGRSATMLVEAVAILGEAGDRLHAAMAQETLRETYESVGKFEQMRSAAETALEMARPLGLHRTISTSLDRLAYHAATTGDLDRSVDLEQQSHHVAQKAGDQWLLAYHACFRADEALAAGRLDEAGHYANQARTMMQELGSKRDLPNVWGRLAWVSLRRGDLDEEAQHAATALALAGECGHLGMVAHQMLRTGVIAAERDEFARATEAIAAALTHYDGHIEHVCIAHCLDAYGLTAARAGDAAPAARFLGASATLMERLGLNRERLDSAADGFKHRDSLRSTLGDDVFNQYFKAGAELTIDAAIAEALAYTPPGSQDEQPVTASQVDRSAGLSPRELEVLRHMANGLSNQEIANTLFLSLRTVTSHVTKILSKLHVHSRTAAVSFAIRNGIA